jgi:hypothetical protein
MRDAFINQGFLRGKCAHCDESFFFKLTVKGIEVEYHKELPLDTPCKSVEEYKEER